MNFQVSEPSSPGGSTPWGSEKQSEASEPPDFGTYSSSSSYHMILDVYCYIQVILKQCRGSQSVLPSLELTESK